jgi:hypothetical protein
MWTPPVSGHLRIAAELAHSSPRPMTAKEAYVNLTNFAGQNWLITPAALAFGEPPPDTIREQLWLLVLTGVVTANLEGNSTSNWLNANLSFLPDMAGPSGSGPLNWAISQYGIQRPAGQNYATGFTVDEWAPFVSLSGLYDQAQSIDAGYAISVWRPNHFGAGTDAFTNAPVGSIFTGVNVDVRVRDTDAWILSLGYNITLRGRIVFTKTPIALFESNFESTTAGQSPSTVEAVGTATFNGPNKVMSPTFPHTGNWLRIGPSSQAGAMFNGIFMNAPNDFGVYTLSAMMFMGSQSSKSYSAESYIGFNTSPGATSSFLTLLFAESNEVLAGGVNPTGCTFPRDQPFPIQVTLNVTPAGAFAQIEVAGAVANFTLNQSAIPFGSISFAQQNAGGDGFYVTDILVTYTA